MYSDDPFQVVQPVKPRPQQKIDPRFLAFGQEAHGAGRGHTVGKPERAVRNEMVCYFVNGRHACYAYRDYCPEAGDNHTRDPRPEPIVFRPARPRT